MRKSYTFFQAIFELTRAIGFTRIQGWAKRLPEYDSLSDEELVLAILRNYERWHEDMDPPEEWLLRYGKTWHDSSLNDLKERLAIGQYTAWGFSKGSSTKAKIPPEIWPSLAIDLRESVASNLTTNHAFSGVTIHLQSQTSSITLNEGGRKKSENGAGPRIGRKPAEKDDVLAEFEYRKTEGLLHASARKEAEYLAAWNVQQTGSSRLTAETIRKLIAPIFPKSG